MLNKARSAFSRITASKGSVTSNIALLASGNIIARLTAAAALPILARLYDPHDFGLYTIYTSLVVLLVPVGTLYALAIPLPKRDYLAAHTAVLSLLFLFGFAAVGGLVLALFGRKILTFFSVPGLIPYWWLIVLGTLGGGIYQVASQWATRKKLFKALAASSVWQSVNSNVVQIGAGVLGFTHVGLLLGSMVSQSSGVYRLWRRMWADVQVYRAKITGAGLKRVLRRFSDFPKYRLPSQFLMAFNSQAVVMFSAAMFGASAVGQLGMATSITTIPVRFLGNAIGKALFAEAASIGRKDPRKLQRLLVTFTRRIALMALLPYGFLVLFAPLLFPVLLGEKWRIAGLISSGLAVYSFGVLANLPVVQIMNAIGRQVYYLRVNISRLLLTLGTLWTAYHFGFSVVHTVWTYALVMSVHYTIMYVAIYRLLRSGPTGGSQQETVAPS